MVLPFLLALHRNGRIGRNDVQATVRPHHRAHGLPVRSLHRVQPALSRRSQHLQSRGLMRRAHPHLLIDTILMQTLRGNLLTR
jgi:hypothetical protein